MKEPRHLVEAVPVSCQLLWGGCSRTSLLRMKCFDVYKSTSWSTFFLCVTLANSIYISILPELIDDSQAQLKGVKRQVTWLDAFDFLSAAVLLFEVATGIIALGFSGRPNTWLHVSDFHKLDLLVLAVTIAEYVGIFVFGLKGVTIRPFRLMRIFRAIIRIKAFSGIKTIIITLRQGLGQMATVFFMLLFFTASFSIFGMAVFQKSFSRRCISLPRPIPVCTGSPANNFKAECDFATDFGAEIISEGGEEIVTGGYPYVRYCDIITNNTPGKS